MINIAVLGYGVVGSGVVEVIEKNNELIKLRSKETINLKYVFDIRDFEGQPIEKFITHNIDDIFNDESVKIIIEVMGGVEPSYSYVKRALLTGKHVVTSNKELVAKKGSELLEIARQNNINFLFEASVAGAIPIIRNIKESITADEITEIKGILNGTTNYILTKMAKKNWSFDEALKKAQEKGYAERDPKNDIEGFDAVRKLAILLSLISGNYVNYENIETTGISEITNEDILFAKEVSASIKLIASAKKFKDGYVASVAPIVLNEKNPISMTDDVANAVLIKGDYMEEIMFYGPGAGKLTTATAIVADIVDIIKNIDKNIGYFWSNIEGKVFHPSSSNEKRFVRISFEDKSNAIHNIKDIFIDSKIILCDEIDNQLAFITKEQKESDFEYDLKDLKKSASDLQILTKLVFE